MRGGRRTRSREPSPLVSRLRAQLTGPVSRGDAGTVAKHLETLTAAAPDSVPVYRELARRTADRAIAAGRLTTSAAAPLLDVLATDRELSQEAAR